MGLGTGSSGLSFSGDFYRGDGQVYRGMAMGSADIQQPSLFEGYSCYTETDSLYGTADMAKGDLCHTAADKLELYDGTCLAQPSLWGPGGSTAAKHPFKMGIEKFQDADVPPDVPADPYFKFEVTTLFALSKSPSDLGNCVLDFLSSQVVSDVKKVRRTKFAINAEVFMHCVMCALKVRMYSLGGQKLAIEFHRRAGNHITFGDVYELAKDHIQKRFQIFGGAPDAPKSGVMRLLAMPPALQSSKGGSLWPLLEMIGSAERPSLQAEAAAALAENIQRDPSSAESLCTPDAFVELQKLLQADGFEILYSAGCLLVALADLPEAERCFASGSLLTAMLTKIRSRALADLARSQLAQALRVAVSRCASVMDGAAAKELSTGLVEAVQETPQFADDPIYRNLHEARFQLMSRSGL